MTDLTDSEIDGLATLGEYYITAPQYVPRPIGRRYFNSPSTPSHHTIDPHDLDGNWSWD